DIGVEAELALLRFGVALRLRQDEEDLRLLELAVNLDLVQLHLLVALFFLGQDRHRREANRQENRCQNEAPQRPRCSASVHSSPDGSPGSRQRLPARPSAWWPGSECSTRALPVWSQN